TRPASTAGLAARFCRRGRGRLRELFPAHALGMDRIGPCLALGYCRLLTQPCEHRDSIMRLGAIACSPSYSPPCQLFCLWRPEHGRIILLADISGRFLLRRTPLTRSHACYTQSVILGARVGP